MNKNNYEWVTIGGAKFYTNGTICTDIEVMNEAKTISFIFPKFRIDREKCKKVFSSVENLIIERNVLSIIIPNKMLPNVKNVESKSSNFMTGKYLIEKAGMRLLNAFVQDEETAIDFTQFNRIEGYAFEGCKTKNAIGLNEMKISMIQDTAFEDSGFLDQPFIGGIKCLGPFIIDIDETADEIILPKNNVRFCVPKKPKERVRVPNVNAFAAMRKLPKKVIIEDKKINYDDALLYNFCSRDIEELESRVPRYKTVDGILYSADMKTLIICPTGKTGTVVIPDGVTRIRKSAFSRSKISKVIFPDSMVSLQNEAFYGCEYLTEIDFGHGIEQIGGNGNQHIFSGCSMKKLVFPPQVKEIGINAFFSCGELKEVIFNEGLETIQRGAFRGCPRLTEIHLPTSIKKVGPEAFLCEVLREGIQDINVNMSTIPEDFGRAFIHPGNMQTPRCINVHIDNKDGIFDFVLPDCASAVTPGYSEIVSACNLMVGQEYDKKFRRLKSAFMYASNSRFKCVDAFKTYKKTKNESAKKYLSDYQKRTAEAIAMELTEKDFVDFLRLDFINLGYDKGIVKRLQEQNWNIALAYMLEEGREENNDALVI
ncbi:leucine-rich repeat domain-containing protein [Blautia massiliensis (ex Durand et al. 2017)]|uniref:leucine-rich repeat domain-containing protein n=1 Tax=Blautia massiliensis (ex Durand et al. 2017) TaxID=1737424 RepID=UPI00189F8C36|nr:leucine-rich repeat domain-containing protein [Blautia massiliensis (ex Durand et al. 2017)]